MAMNVSRGTLTKGAAAGLAASVVMGMYAMTVSAFHDTGFFTPLYHIASSIGSPTAMMGSMKAAAAGDSTFLSAGSALLGAVIHMMVGAMAGVVFAVLLGLRPMSKVATVIAGAVYGLLVMAVNSLIALPVTAAVFDSGDAVAHMGRTAGWTTFTIEHLVYGLALAVLLATVLRPTSATAATDRPASVLQS